MNWLFFPKFVYQRGHLVTLTRQSHILHYFRTKDTVHNCSMFTCYDITDSGLSLSVWHYVHTDIVLEHICRGWEVSLVLYPSTAEDSLSQFVRLTLTLSLDSQVLPYDFITKNNEFHFLTWSWYWPFLGYGLYRYENCTILSYSSLFCVNSCLFWIRQCELCHILE